MDFILPNHHAVLFVSQNRKKDYSTICKSIKDISLSNLYIDSTVIDIDTSRKLTSWSNIPKSGHKIAILSFNTITIPAQNALLKLLEDPSDGVSFILITGNKELLLPTLTSRCEEYIYNKNNNLSFEKEIILFLKTESQRRMELSFIEKMINKKDEEGRKDREIVRTFLLELTSYIKDKKNFRKNTKEIIEMTKHISLPSASTKNILEYVSLLLP